MTFGMQLHILRWYVIAASKSTFMGTAHTDCMCCNHILFCKSHDILFKQALPKFMATSGQ